jgi:hypothetical protein
MVGYESNIIYAFYFSKYPNCGVVGLVGKVPTLRFYDFLLQILFQEIKNGHL